MASPKPLIDPRAARLLRNPDFMLFVEGMKQMRAKLFEQGEADDELRSIFEKRGKRQMLKFLCSEEGVSQVVSGMKT